MKKTIFTILLLASALFLSSCRKEDTASKIIGLWAETSERDGNYSIDNSDCVYALIRFNEDNLIMYEERSVGKGLAYSNGYLIGGTLDNNYTQLGRAQYSIDSDNYLYGQGVAFAQIIFIDKNKFKLVDIGDGKLSGYAIFERVKGFK